MDNTAFFNLTYGLFVVTSTSNKKSNGCVINTASQVANSPTRIAISCLKENYTTELINESKVFALSVLDNTVTYSTIENFGLKSGRDFDKFRYACMGKDVNGIPYLAMQSNALFSCKVVDQIDLGSHIMFIGEVVDAKKLSDFPSVTYAQYHSDIKPKVNIDTNRTIIGWRCKICGYVYQGEQLPKDFLCPTCGHDISDFEPIYQ